MKVSHFSLSDFSIEIQRRLHLGTAYEEFGNPSLDDLDFNR